MLEDLVGNNFRQVETSTEVKRFGQIRILSDGHGLTNVGKTVRNVDVGSSGRLP